MLISILLTAALWWGASLLIAASWRDPVTRLLATLIVGFSAIVAVTELLSLCGLFKLAPVAVVCLLILAIGHIAHRLSRTSARNQDDSAFEPTSVAIDRQHETAMRALCWLVLVAAGLMAGDGLLYGLLHPVQVDSDAPIYHLPFAIHWARVGRLEMIATPFGEEGAPYFPANGDLWLAWLAVTSHGAAIIKVGQWPFLAAGGLALFTVARQIDASRAAAAVVGGLWCCLPLTLRQASLANVDLIWTAFYFAALHFVIRFCDVRQSAETSLWDLSLAGLALGIVLGTKSLGLVFVPLLLLPLTWRIWTHRPAPDAGSTGKYRWRAMVVLASALLLPSVYWMARNAWLTGNPLYPLDVSLGGQSLLVGMFDSAAMRRTAYHIPVAEWSFLPARLRYTCGPILASLWVVGLLTGLTVPGSNDAGGRTITTRLISLLALAQVAIFWFVVPYNSQERFLLPALGIGLLPLARTLTLWPVLSWPVLLLVVAHFMLALGAGPAIMDIASFRVLRGESLSELRWWGAGLCMLLSLVTMVKHLHRLSPRPRQSTLIAIATVIVACGCLYAGPIERVALMSTTDGFYPETGFGARMLPAWRIVEEFSASGPARVAYAGGNLPYYLRGSRLWNDVRYININPHRDWLSHDYHLARHAAGHTAKAAIPWPQWDREQTDVDAWLANLRAANVDLLFVSRVNLHGRIVDLRGELPPFPIERTWAAARPDVFEDLGPPEEAGVVAWARVYRIRAGASSDGARPE